jgi:hypothetical protein
MDFLQRPLVVRVEASPNGLLWGKGSGLFEVKAAGGGLGGEID